MAGSSTRLSAADALGKVILVTGKEEFLSERTVTAVRDAVRAHDQEAELAESRAADLTLAALGELAAPSLFSSIRCVVVRGLEDLPEESVDGVLAYAAEPAEDVALVLVHGGGQKGSGVLAKLRKLPSVTEHKSAELRPSEFQGFVAAEARALKAQIDDEAAKFLVDAVGQDLRGLSAATSQLTHDFPGERIDLTKVKKYFGGRAEAKSFAVADAAFYGRRAAALEELRWAMDAGTPPVPAVWRSSSPPRGPCGRPTWPARSGCRRGSSAPSASRRTAGPTPTSPARSGRSPRPTPTSKGPRATRRTPSSDWSSRSPGCARPERPGRPHPGGGTRGSGRPGDVLRFFIIGFLVILGAFTTLAAAIGGPGWWILLALVVLLLCIGIYDLVLIQHWMLRKYPVVCQLRFLMVEIRPELLQYFIERNYDGRPFDRNTRTSI